MPVLSSGLFDLNEIVWLFYWKTKKEKEENKLNYTYKLYGVYMHKLYILYTHIYLKNIKNKYYINSVYVWPTVKPKLSSNYTHTHI